MDCTEHFVLFCTLVTRVIRISGLDSATNMWSVKSSTQQRSGDAGRHAKREVELTLEKMSCPVGRPERLGRWRDEMWTRQRVTQKSILWQWRGFVHEVMDVSPVRKAGCLELQIRVEGRLGKA